tara:strand:- start:982 stop:1890 length:909 start_codon:yes stop_codon:yes gene_type:complete
MPIQKPAVSIAAVPGRRKMIIDLAVEIEKQKFAGIYCPSMGDNIGLCTAIGLNTKSIPFGTTITPIYTRNPVDFAQSAAFIHEISNGRFHFGIGVSHAPAMDRLGVAQGKPISDIRNFVKAIRSAPRVGELPPIILAALRKRMIILAEEIAEGIVFANGAKSHMAFSLNNLKENTLTDTQFFIGNMIPTCISEDVETAKNVNRKTLSTYAMLPNYRNYWKEAGYIDEMNAIEEAINAGKADQITNLLSDKWLADTTLFGPPNKIREGIESWFDAGIHNPIIVPSSAAGNQLKAFEELIKIWK